MYDLRNYKTLTPKQITTAIGQLNHNSAPKIMAHLAGRAAPLSPLRNNRSRAKARQLLRRIKKAHKAGRIPFELTVTGCRIDRGSHNTSRYHYDDRLTADEGWQQYDTEEDAWYFGIWINPRALETFTYAEGDTRHVMAPSIEAFRAELVRLYQYHPQAPAFISIDLDAGSITHISIDLDAGSITHHFEAKPEV